MKKGRPSTTDDSFTEFVIDQLADLGVVEARRMFGGRGLYWKDQIFGLVDEGRVFFRVCETTAVRYEAEGSKPFEPWPGHVMKGYWELPARVLEDGEEAAAWAREAWSLPRGQARTAARKKAQLAKSPEGGGRTRAHRKPAPRKPAARKRR